MSVVCELEAIELQVEYLTGGRTGLGCDPGGRTDHARSQPAGELGDALLRLGRVVERLGALRALWAEQFEGGSEWAADGARSGSAWIAARATEHPSSARARMHSGRDLRALPLMADAALRGEVRLGHVRLLVGAARAKPHRWAALAEVEELATKTAAEVSEPRFARFVERWAALADAQHDASLRAQGIDVPVTDHGAAEQAERRELFLSRYGSEGTWALSGTLDTETGLALSMALESVCEAIRGEDRDRDLAQLRHDALAVLLNGQLSAGLPVHKGVRPHIMVITRDDAPPCTDGHSPGPGPGPSRRDLAAPSQAELLDRTDGTVGGLWVTGLARQRLSCDAATQSLVIDAEGVPLRLGRSARVVPPALRRVIDIRDRHCAFAGCSAPAMWCQAHHMVHWEDGGPTDERNLVLVCAFHHNAVHERGFGLRWSPDGRQIETLRPDRTVIVIGHRQKQLLPR
ncbi:MAG TPA: DUF222 domain-containing protein [Motilibacterales bacterium]|nr:DUF222 domain-containing protein [Motilibacterales bacterium]